MADESPDARAGALGLRAGEAFVADDGRLHVAVTWARWDALHDAWRAAPDRARCVTGLSFRPAHDALVSAGLAWSVRFAALAAVPALTTLDLVGTGVEGARALVELPQLAQLTCLRLHGNALGAEGVRTLVSATQLAGLTTLDLDNDEIGDDGARALAGAVHFDALTQLQLHVCDIGDDGARALAGATQFTSLATLEIERNAITDDGARALATAPHLANVRIVH